jgi:hypothetical protein
MKIREIENVPGGRRETPEIARKRLWDRPEISGGEV